MKKDLLPQSGRFYKANLHSHSTLSDGTLTPEEMKEAYKAQGYSVLAYTDHDIFIPHHDLTDDSFVALAGFEAAFNQYNIYPAQSRSVKSTHLCFIARSQSITKHPCWSPEYAYVGNAKDHHVDVIPDESNSPFERDYSPEGINEMIQKCREAGFFVTYNHPTWSLESFEDYKNYNGINAVEILNYSCDVAGFDAYVPTVYDDMLRCNKRIFAVAADDNHNKHPIGSPGSDSFGGFVMIKAEGLTYDLITEALFKGDFYSSSGPEIYELYIENDVLHVVSSDAVQIKMSTNCRVAGAVRAEKGGSIRAASFPISTDVEYVRITVKDAQGNSANTNAYFIER